MKTLLLVEDEEAVRDLAREILMDHSYTVLEARHPGEALLVAERRSAGIDLLLTDIVMPEMNGRELAERLTTLQPCLKVVYMTGYTGRRHRPARRPGDQGDPPAEAFHADHLGPCRARGAGCAIGRG